VITVAKKLAVFYAEARSKVTTYVGLFIASAGEIRNSWPDLTSNLPTWPWLTWIENHTFVALGLLVIYTRVRRALKDA
jgi:hypothetical protein